MRQLLDVDEEGLSTAEAQHRMETIGPNELQEEPPTSVWILFLKQFRSPLIYILVVAAIVTFALGDFIDTGVIVAVLLLNAIIGFTQEHQAEVSIRSLARMVQPHARVVRDGHITEIESRELVPGDIVLLESGNRVAADVRISSDTALMVDESLLTGESAPVVKTAEPVEPNVTLGDRLSMLYAGTTVTSGRARGYVVATGTSTELGKIASEVRHDTSPETPLQRQIERFTRVIVAATLVSAAIAFIFGISRGTSAAEMFETVVAMAVSAVPEGLPIVVTVTLAISVRRMASRNAIIRHLPAAETLGSTTVIGSDKTGTLTENRLTVQAIWAGAEVVTLNGHAPAPNASNKALSELLNEAPDPRDMTLVAGVLANEADYYIEDGQPHVSGDPTEVALLRAAADFGVDPAAIRADYDDVVELPFEPERRFSAIACTVDDVPYLFVKGAPERVLSMCDTMLGREGTAPIDPEMAHDAAAELAGQGLRVLAMAYRRLPDMPASALDIADPEGLTLAGLQGMMDPPREGVLEAVQGCQRAGIRVVMITGDHLGTARSIARDLNIGSDDSPALTGADIADMDEDALRDRVRSVSIYARMAPDHKLRVVRALQEHGEVVAVTGDGANDAPALRSADIGIAMGLSGTDIAREAADMVLIDDNFVSIYAAVEEGRVAFANLRKVTFFLISSGAAEILAIVATILFRWPLPFLPAQILWLNLVTNGLQDVALAFEPGERGIMDRPPRSRRERLMNGLMWERTAIAGLVMATGTLFLFDWTLGHGSLAEAQTVALTTMVVYQAFHVGNARSSTDSLFRLSPFSNRFLFLAALSALAVHAAALYLPPTQFILRVEPISLEAWGRIIVVALSIIAAMELHKLIRRPSTTDLPGM